MFKVLVGQVPAVAPIGRQQRVIACLRSGDDGVLVIALQDLIFHLVAGLCDQAEHAGVEAAGQTLVHAQVLGGAVCRDDDLLVVADELVHELEKVVHARALADDVLMSSMMSTSTPWYACMIGALLFFGGRTRSSGRPDMPGSWHT